MTTQNQTPGSPPSSNGNGSPLTKGHFPVDLPQGGKLFLQNAEEVALWENSALKYIDDYHLSKTNDLTLLGVILQQMVVAFRAQRAINGMRPEIDGQGVPTGAMVMQEIKTEDMGRYLKMLTDASDHIQKIEKVLGIDKTTREAGGTMSVEQYIRRLKRAAHERGIHIAKRTLAYEAFCNDLRTRLRILFNTDAEDRAYHNITYESICQWASDELKALEQVDIQYDREKGKVYVGRL